MSGSESSWSARIGVVVGGDDSWLDLVDLIGGLLWWVDLDEVWHDLDFLAILALERHHNLDLEAENTLSHVDMTHSLIDKLLLGLTGGDKVTSSVLLGLCSLTTDLTTDHDCATNGSTSHDIIQDVVDGHTNWVSAKKLELEDLTLERGIESSVVVEWLDDNFDLVILIVEIISLLDDGLDLSDLSGTILDKCVGVGNSDSDLGGHGSGSDLDTRETFLG